LLKIASDSGVARRLGRTPFSLLELVWIPIKDHLIAVLWAVAALKRTVNWRGNRLRIGRGSVLERRGTSGELAREALEAG
jgi:ceramide glucosyltransferase